MKRLITIIAILLLILAAALLGLKNIEKTNKEMNLHLASLIDLSQSQDQDAIEDTIEQLKARWDKKGNHFEMYVMHENVESVEQSLIELQALCSLSQYDQMLPVIKQIQYDLEQIYEGELPYLKNIF